MSNVVYSLSKIASVLCVGPINTYLVCHSHVAVYIYDAILRYYSISNSYGCYSLTFVRHNILNAKNLAPPFLSIFSGTKSMISKINVL